MLKPILDPYDRTARLKPGLLCSIPLITSVVLLIPQFGVVWGLVSTMVVYCGGTLLLIQIVRDLGKSSEDRLYRAWGGKPSVAMLRLRDDRLDGTTKARYRKFLQETVPDLEFASSEEELSDPKHGDDVLESANRWLLSQTKDHTKFNLLFVENVGYGFRRNLYGMKWLTLTLDAIAITFVGGMGIAGCTGNLENTFQNLEPEWWVSLLIVVLHSFVFSLYITSGWVRSAAESYASELLAACDMLGENRN